MSALHVILMVICIGAGPSGCRGRSPQITPTTPPAVPSADSPSAKIWISKAGAIELNEKQVDLEAVNAELADLAKRKGVVLYGREAPEEEPHANGMKVIEIAARNRLPIRMSTRRDFSDAIGPDGKLRQ